MDILTLPSTVSKSTQHCAGAWQVLSTIVPFHTREMPIRCTTYSSTLISFIRSARTAAASKSMRS